MLSTTLQMELKNMFGDEVGFDIPLSQHTHIHIGGPADAIVWPKETEQLRQVIIWAKEKKIPYFILGKGSNTLMRDGGFRGVIIHLGKGFRHFGLAPPPASVRHARSAGEAGGGVAKENGHFVWVEAQGGVPTQQLVRWCAEQGFAGVEVLAGVPGTVGGNVYMNAGTYLGEIADRIEEVDICDSKGRLMTLPKEKLRFEYRSSNIPPSSVVVRAVLKLEKKEKEAIEKQVRAVFEKRGLAQPVELPNLGSVFKNPGASEDLASPVRAKGARGDGAPTERSEAGQRSPRYQQKRAWELIEEAGCRGVRIGKARVSEKHANFIVNEGGATAKDVLILIGLIKDRVKEATGILLETEIKVVGE